MFSTARRGAISVEYIIILVLIALGGILGFMLLQGAMRSNMEQGIETFQGAADGTEKVERVADDDLQSTYNMDMEDSKDWEASADTRTAGSE